MGDPLGRDEIQRHKAAFLEVVPKASKHEMLALSPAMTILSVNMHIKSSFFTNWQNVVFRLCQLNAIDFVYDL